MPVPNGRIKKPRQIALAGQLFTCCRWSGERVVHTCVLTRLTHGAPDEAETDEHQRPGGGLRDNRVVWRDFEIAREPRNATELHINIVDRAGESAVPSRAKARSDPIDAEARTGIVVDQDCKVLVPPAVALVGPSRALLVQKLPLSRSPAPVSQVSVTAGIVPKL